VTDRRSIEAADAFKKRFAKRSGDRRDLIVTTDPERRHVPVVADQIVVLQVVLARVARRRADVDAAALYVWLQEVHPRHQVDVLLLARGTADDGYEEPIMVLGVHHHRRRDLAEIGQTGRLPS